MPKQECDVCGNLYDKAFQIHFGNATHTFDSFECAISKLAPRCEQCGTRIMGHGVEADGSIYCCAHCSRKAGESGLSDRQ